MSLFVLTFFSVSSADAAKCLYISSYHSGYEWNDGIEHGIESVLKDKCELEKFYMDTKRNKSKEFGEKAALRAKAYIEKTHPNILIAADDNASRYLIKPYFKDVKLPVVFCGINHTVEPYGYPYTNATGMIEISPILPLYKYLKSSQERIRHGVYLASDVISQHREFELNQEFYATKGIQLTPMFVTNMKEWLVGYRKAQRQADFLVLGNNGGIKDWDDEKAINLSLQEGKLLSVTSYDWMNRYVILAVTKLAEEQGEWAAKVALAVLSGEKIGDIPIVVNRRWNVFINRTLLKASGLKLSPKLMTRVKRISL